MNVPNDDNYDGSTDAGASSSWERLQRLRNEVAAQSEAARKRQAFVLMAMSVMAVVMMFGLSQVNQLATQMDSSTLARIGGMHAVQNLPEGRQAIEKVLADRAPELIAESVEVALNSLPSFRALLVEQVHSSLGEIHSEFERSTVRELTLALREAKMAIDRAYPEASDEEKFLLVAKTAIDDFRFDFDRSLDDLYPSYSVPMKQMNEYMGYLAESEDHELTRAEQRKREIIETVLQLIVRYREGELAL